MVLQLFDTAAHRARPFVPLRPGRVSIYVCGPTVQSGPHIGHLRSAVVFDQLRRWLENGHGHEVTLIRNVTDLDDKVLSAGREANRQWWALAAENARAFSRAYDILGVRPPTHEPWATGHIAEMITFIERLVERGHAYRAEDGSADVYFDVASWTDYGSLTGQDSADTLADASVTQVGKRDPRDFTLWKSVDADPGVTPTPVSAAWPSPFGTGRPGWHLSCSTMIHRYLGPDLDIHAGGLDLRFPHHENEQAQSRAAGYGFARYWMHNGWVTVAGDKMAKSLGNAVPAEDLLRRVRPVNLRYYLASAHYRSNLDFDPEALTAASSAVRRIEEFLHRGPSIAGASALPRHDDDAPLGPIPQAFRHAMDDDLNVPAALAAIHRTVHDGNAALDRRDLGAATTALTGVATMTGILGLDPTDPTRSQRPGADDGLAQALQALVSTALGERSRARSQGNFLRADEIREQLQTAGIALTDTAEGPSWRIAGREPVAADLTENETAREAEFR